MTDAWGLRLHASVLIVPDEISSSEKSRNWGLTSCIGLVIVNELASEQAIGWVAQLVEQGTENPCVGGSTPSPATIETTAPRKGAFFMCGEIARSRTREGLPCQRHGKG